VTTYSADDRAKALAVYRQHGPREAARRFGMSKSTVSRWAQAEGISAAVPAERTRAATEAAQLTAKQRRVRLKDAMLEDADTIRRLILAPQTVIVDGQVHEQVHPSPRDMRDLGVTLGILVDKYAVLDARDDDNGVEEAKGLLVALRDQIGMGHE
jgi:transposase